MFRQCCHIVTFSNNNYIIINNIITLRILFIHHFKITLEQTPPLFARIHYASKHLTLIEVTG